jgi:hypothetical protein
MKIWLVIAVLGALCIGLLGILPETGTVQVNMTAMNPGAAKASASKPISVTLAPESEDRLLRVTVDKQTAFGLKLSRPLEAGEKLIYTSNDTQVASVLQKDELGDGRYYGMGPLRGGQIRAFSAGSAEICVEVHSLNGVLDLSCVTVVSDYAIQPFHKADTKVSASSF